jgi:hypothetical protein
MLGRRTLGAGMTCEFHTLGVSVYDLSRTTERIDMSLGWNSQGFIAPNSVEAQPRYRQSHERGCYP